MVPHGNNKSPSLKNHSWTPLPQRKPSSLFSSFPSLHLRHTSGFEGQVWERDWERSEVWELKEVTGGSWRWHEQWHDWQHQWWPMAGLVVTFKKGEQEETTMKARVCKKSSQLWKVDDKFRHRYPTHFFVLYAMDRAESHFRVRFCWPSSTHETILMCSVRNLIHVNFLSWELAWFGLKM